MTAARASREQLAGQRRDSAGYRDGYAEVQRAYLIGRAVRERRLALGLSQVQFAALAATDRLLSAHLALQRSKLAKSVPFVKVQAGESPDSDPTCVIRAQPRLASGEVLQHRRRPLQRHRRPP